MIQREVYLNQLIANKERPVIKVITGVRRSGKSTLFSLYINYLKESGVTDDQIILVNLEDMVYEFLLDYRELHAYIREKLSCGKYTYVFIDEVQNCPHFEKAIDSLFIQPQVDVYITGSNAHLLSGELATLLSGRYITIHVLPLSFREYCEVVKSSQLSFTSAFNRYVRYGSFPYVAYLENEDTIRPYLEGIYHTIVIKDVSQRADIPDLNLLEDIVKTLISCICSPVSIKKISDTVNSAGRKTSVNTVDRYLRALCDSYLFYRVDRYDIKGRQHLKTMGKYYVIDTGIRSYLLSGAATDTGHTIENIVYLELLRRGYKVHTGKQGVKEVDFVAEDMNGTCYYQVAATVFNGETLRRELEPLRLIEDHFPKILLTLDEMGDNSHHEGIRQYNLIKWLLNSEQKT